MHHWLLKTEPDTFGIDHLERAPRRTTSWDGVRNYQARNMLRDQMQRGDQAFLYYSSCEVPGIVAIAAIVKPGYPDPTAFDRGRVPRGFTNQRRIQYWRHRRLCHYHHSLFPHQRRRTGRDYST